ncbi:hypothetical protein KC318_g6099 [Hortaea werneckii]|nr:hypothetical protein KC334_g2745 [Hortaea werneckii]KAI7010556.1 hypothetical protein KC355_g6128 [Hortaea werneckii]KAI7198816.1 hypothetical protein KC324_g3582 [Hortaea werneckii]KAI7585325.1 hypothetical protein KC316_g6232 [Hortaea werneckii]KAI7667103.1 hypothetical protein KC318_g6099 [Hortaea werneckii]
MSTSGSGTSPVTTALAESVFGNLPKELRDDIFIKALTHSKRVTLLLLPQGQLTLVEKILAEFDNGNDSATESVSSATTPATTVRDTTTLTLLQGLPSTCRELYRETKTYFYRDNAFTVKPAKRTPAVDEEDDEAGADEDPDAVLSKMWTALVQGPGRKNLERISDLHLEGLGLILLDTVEKGDLVGLGQRLQEIRERLAVHPKTGKAARLTADISFDRMDFPAPPGGLLPTILRVSVSVPVGGSKVEVQDAVRMAVGWLWDDLEAARWEDGAPDLDMWAILANYGCLKTFEDEVKSRVEELAWARVPSS